MKKFKISYDEWIGNQPADLTFKDVWDAAYSEGFHEAIFNTQIEIEQDIFICVDFITDCRDMPKNPPETLDLASASLKAIKSRAKQICDKLQEKHKKFA